MGAEIGTCSIGCGRRILTGGNRENEANVCLTCLIPLFALFPRVQSKFLHGSATVVDFMGQWYASIPVQKTYIERCKISDS